MLTTTPLTFPMDPVLGGPLTWLDPQTILTALGDQLDDKPRSEHRNWRACRMVEALYHPGRYVRAAYVLSEDPDLQADRAWPEGQIVYIHSPARSPMSRRGTLLCVGNVEVEAYVFPNDRRLRGLRKFAGKQAAATTWQEWIDAGDGDFRIDETSLQRLMVRYVPEQKWIVRLRAEGKNAKGETEKRRIAVRSADPDVCRRLADRHTSLRDAEAAQTSVFQIPQVVGFSPEQGILAVEWIRGQRLIDVLRDNDPSAVMQRVAGVLAGVHGARVSNLVSLTEVANCARVQEATDDLAAVRPLLRERLSSLSKELQSCLTRLETVAPVTLHNDFHWNQLSIKKDRWALLDLERMCLGDPMIDVANFAMQIRLLAFRPDANVAQDTARLWSNHFLEEWLGHTGESIDAVRFNSYAALTCLELARGMMRHLRLGWDELINDCVEEAESLLCDPQAKVGGQ